jgi:hypothetical protein
LLRRQEIIQFLVEAKLGKADLSGVVVSSCHDSLIPVGITNYEATNIRGQVLSAVFRP